MFSIKPFVFPVSFFGQHHNRATKNYRGITLTAAKVYSALLLICMKPEIEKILRKNQNSFGRNQSTTLQILTIHQIIKGVPAKNLPFCS